jgi:S-adenosylmethionine:tRNA-ribosyltransferase-isomerase (queuine synthetase)/predicted adenine nucleotide alpha hydrolase (AANH) superfamily ATPase/5,10-methylene-tetrahydrofolate dehydrogenase/methenyl tetrahydrofolate cyclohydrolase/pterin-4a-carbinolamine dehydratase
VKLIVHLCIFHKQEQLVLGTCEQYVLSPLIHNSSMPVAAIGAMFGRSPIAVAMLAPATATDVPRKIGTHDDTVELVQRLFPDSEVVAVPRELKMGMLLSGELDGVQIYDAMEALELDQRKLAPVVLPLCGREGSNLGYAQAIFMPQFQLANEEQAHHARSFMAATEEGWLDSIKDPTRAAEIVLRMQPSQDEVGHHWKDSLSFTTATVKKCNDYVKTTRRGASLLTVDPVQWSKADRWILGSRGGIGGGDGSGVGGGGSGGGLQAQPKTLDQSVWKVPSNLMVGHDVARPMLSDVRAQATRIAKERSGRSPSLAIIAVGAEHSSSSNANSCKDVFHSSKNGSRRQQLFSPQQHSWFSRTETGRSLGIDVTPVLLDGNLTQRALETEIRQLREFDAIQIAEPTPPHLDVHAAIRVMRPSQDVDSRGYMNGDTRSSVPLTASAVMRLLKHNKVELRGKKAVVIGKGPLVGLPITKALMEDGATVSLAHSSTPRDVMQEMVEGADIVLPCVGHPGLIEASWVREEAVVCNVGTTFDPASDRLLPDVANIDLLLKDALATSGGVVGSCPGGVGPIVVAELFQRVVEIAAQNCHGVFNPAAEGADEQTSLLSTSAVLEHMSASLKDWSLGSTSGDRGKIVGTEPIPVLNRRFHFASFGQATEFINAVAASADQLNHHPNVQILHQCTAGVDVDVEIFTYDVSGITEYDFALARVIDESFRPTFKAPLAGEAQQMIDVDVEQFVFDLPEDRIAIHPRLPRGSSKLLVRVPDRHTRHPLQQHIRAQAMGREDTTVDTEFVDAEFRDIAQFLPSNAHLVFNESKVFPARLFATIDPSGSTAAAASPFEVMFLNSEADTGRSDAALAQPCEGQAWRCMIRLPFVTPGTALLPTNNAALLAQGRSAVTMEVTTIHSPWIEEGETDGVEATVVFREVGGGVPAEPITDVRDDARHSHLTMEGVFNCLGDIPLPPYMRRTATEADTDHYQTVYANECGSVAAPTAGLHFTDELLATLKEQGVKSSKVSLHVGAGTFRPITVSNAADHDMHEEQFSVSQHAIMEMVRSLKLGRPLVPVGTTSVRVLESLYWLGVHALDEERAEAMGRELPRLNQWAPYEARARAGEDGLPSNIDALEALCKVGPWAHDGGAVRGTTSLCIVPGYQFQLCDALITNFHQPHSTLMLLVAALVGGTGEIRNVYDHALEKDFQFLSYGDACLLFNGEGGRQVARSAGADVGSNGGPEDSVLAPGTKVLLHSCCAPCSGAMIEQMHHEGHDVTIFFYNPNIHPKEEYELRKAENVRYAEKLGIPIIDADYDPENWHRQAKGMEFDPEQGRRCSMCFDMRFERTAAYAKAHGFPVISSTNATSRWKDAEQVNASGQWAVSQVRSISSLVFLPSRPFPPSLPPSLPPLLPTYLPACLPSYLPPFFPPFLPSVSSFTVLQPVPNPATDIEKPHTVL